MGVQGGFFRSEEGKKNRKKKKKEKEKEKKKKKRRRRKENGQDKAKIPRDLAGRLRLFGLRRHWKQSKPLVSVRTTSKMVHFVPLEHSEVRLM